MVLDNQSKINWVLTRGLSREIRHWHNFPDKLKESFPNHLVFPLELPGAGKKYLSKVPSNIKSITNELRQEWLKFKDNVEGPWGIISISLGGMIAMDWCQRFPQDFERIVIINSSAGNLSPITERFSTDAIKMVGRLFFQSDLEKREREILELTLNLKEVMDDIVKLYAQYAREYPLNRKSFVAQVFSASKFKIPKKIKQEFLILAAKGDRLASWKCSEAIAEHFKRPLRLHPEAGHDLPLDDPDWILNQINEWLN